MRRADLALAIPYVAVLIGLYALRSAWLAILLYHAGILVCLLPALSRNASRELARGWSLTAAAPLLLASAASGPLLVLLWPAIALDSEGLAVTLANFGLLGPAWWAFAGYYVTVHPALEELFWRSPARPRGRPVWDRAGISWGDLAFTGYHALVLRFFVSPPWVLAILIILVLTALIWRRLATRYGGLAIPLLAHAIAGVSTLAAAYLLARM